MFESTLTQRGNTHTRRDSLWVVLSAVLAAIAITFDSTFCQVRTANNVIAGIVTDAASGNPLPAVNVFLRNTTKGTTSEKNGGYELRDLPAGDFELVFSLIGYERDVRHISLTDSMVVRLDISLKPREIGVAQVEVTGSAEEWKKLLPVFTTELLGATRNADECKIVNPEVVRLWLSATGDTLHASTDTTLVVDNYALGYRVYLLIDWFFLAARLGRFEMNCYPRYEEMSPKDESEKAEWKERRASVYDFSFRRFLHSVLEQPKGPKQFLITTGNIRQLQRGKGDDIEDTCLVVTSSRDGHRFRIDFSSDYVRVDRRDQYGSRKVPLSGIVVRLPQGINPTYNDWFSFWLATYYVPTHKQAIELMMTEGPEVPENFASSIVLIKNRPLQVDQFGNLVKPLAVSFVGFWGTQRLADSLPFDYKAETE